MRNHALPNAALVMASCADGEGIPRCRKDAQFCSVRRARTALFQYLMHHARGGLRPRFRLSVRGWQVVHT
jgi:hypothetical protein